MTRSTWHYDASREAHGQDTHGPFAIFVHQTAQARKQSRSEAGGEQESSSSGSVMRRAALLLIPTPRLASNYATSGV
jgi:hypothetical protein